MSTHNWFILSVDGADDVLLHCTPKDWERIPLRPAEPRAPRSVDDAQTSKAAREALRFAPEGGTGHSSAKEPRATHVVNDLRSEGHATEQHLRRLGQAVKEALAPYDDAPLYVAMGEARGAMFETVGKVPVAAHLPQQRAQDLWQQSKSMATA